MSTQIYTQSLEEISGIVRACDAGTVINFPRELPSDTVELGTISFSAKELAKIMKTNDVIQDLKRHFPWCQGCVLDGDSLPPEDSPLSNDDAPCWLVSRQSHLKQTSWLALLCSRENVVLALKVTHIGKNCFTVPIVGGKFEASGAVTASWPPRKKLPARATRINFGRQLREDTLPIEADSLPVEADSPPVEADSLPIEDENEEESSPLFFRSDKLPPNTARRRVVEEEEDDDEGQHVESPQREETASFSDNSPRKRTRRIVAEEPSREDHTEDRKPIDHGPNRERDVVRKDLLLESGELLRTAAKKLLEEARRLGAMCRDIEMARDQVESAMIAIKSPDEIWEQCKSEGWEVRWDFDVLHDVTRRTSKDYVYAMPGVTKKTSAIGVNVFWSVDEVVNFVRKPKKADEEARRDIVESAERAGFDSFAERARIEPLDKIKIEFARIVRSQENLRVAAMPRRMRRNPR